MRLPRLSNLRFPRPPAFWWTRRSIGGYALAPLGWAYGAVSGHRIMLAGAVPPIPVICVGNLVAGGAGKTPTAIEVANACRGLGLKPGFLTRGYGGRERGPIVVTPAIHDAADVGDEALLLAREAPTVASSDRPSGVKLLAGLGADVVVMDDGFQNPSLVKSLSLVVVDAARGIGNGFVLPAGPLRAPLMAQIRRADALILTGDGPGGEAVRAAARAGLPVLRAHAEPQRRRGLRRKPYLAFAGIAQPARFYAMLAASGAAVAETKDFADHHVFAEAECEALLKTAAEKGFALITTEKDLVRMTEGGEAARKLAASVETFPIRMSFEEPRRLIALINDAVSAHGSAYRRANITSAGEEIVPA